MSCMNASVHDLHHRTKLQLSTRCSFGVIKLGINFQNVRVGKVLGLGFAELRNQINFAHCSNELCIFNCNKYRTSNVSRFGCVTILFYYIN